MADYIFFMHDDAPDPVGDWAPYLAGLRARGCFEGGSEIGDGICVTRSGSERPITAQLTGFIRVQAADLTEARALLVGNPVYDAGGTVEIRELPRS